jgi:hypothetical protein
MSGVTLLRTTSTIGTCTGVRHCVDAPMIRRDLSIFLAGVRADSRAIHSTYAHGRAPAPGEQAEAGEPNVLRAGRGVICHQIRYVQIELVMAETTNRVSDDRLTRTACRVSGAHVIAWCIDSRTSGRDSQGEHSTIGPGDVSRAHLVQAKPVRHH